jgi:hypothetical protein
VLDDLVSLDAIRTGLGEHRSIQADRFSVGSLPHLRVYTKRRATFRRNDLGSALSPVSRSPQSLGKQRVPARSLSFPPKLGSGRPILV